MTLSSYELPVIYFCIKLNLWNKVYDQMRMATLTLIHNGHARELFMTISFLQNGCTFEE